MVLELHLEDDLRLRKNADNTLAVTFYSDDAYTTEYDWNGPTATLQIRSSKESPTAALALSVGSGLAFSGGGTVTITVPKATAGSVTLTRGVYDLVANDGVQDFAVMEGRVQFDPGVTR